jgi:hypothetical protein
VQGTQAFFIIHWQTARSSALTASIQRELQNQKKLVTVIITLYEETESYEE